jgi:hypothetical protein
MLWYIQILPFSITHPSSKAKTSDGNFKAIVPYNYNGYQCNVLIGWENGETTDELLKVIGTDDPVT